MRAPRSELARSSRPISSSACAQRRPRVHCITNAVAQNFTANVLLAAGAVPSMTIAPKEIAPSSRAPTRCWSISARSMPERQKACACRDRRGQQGAHALGARSGVHRPLAAARGFRQDAGRARSRRALRLNRAEFGALAGGNAERRWRMRALCAKACAPWSALTGERDLVSRRRAARHHRQRPSADGARHRDGLRRLGAGRRVPRGRGRRLAGDRGGADHVRRRGRDRGGRARGPGSFAMEILDALYGLDRDTLIGKAKVT